MDVVLYKNASDRNVLDKDISSLGTVTGVEIKAPFSIESPNLVLHTNIIDFNYIFIPRFSRYYYATPTLRGAGIIEISNAESDSLMSFKDEIKALSGIADRQSNVYDNFLIDRLFKADNKMTTLSYPFGTSIGTVPTYILLTL